MINLAASFTTGDVTNNAGDTFSSTDYLQYLSDKMFGPKKSYNIMNAGDWIRFDLKTS